MVDTRFLIVRLGSMGDIVHALPAVHALRESFPEARIDWVVETKWQPLVRGNPDINEAIPVKRTTWTILRTCLGRLRAGRYDCLLDFQGLYKSAALGWLSGTKKRIGWDRRAAREGGAAVFYTRPVTPRAAHVVDQNIELAQAAGAQPGAVKFFLPRDPQAEREVESFLSTEGLGKFFVLSPGGGWRAKCWPPERYGELHRALAERYGMRGVVNYGPGEEQLAAAVRASAGTSAPIPAKLRLEQFLALVRRATFLVGGDSGPLHVAVAVGTPVVGLYGPTDPARNGPYSKADIVVRNAGADETTYKRGDEYASSMLSITVEQVLAAVERRREQVR